MPIIESELIQVLVEMKVIYVEDPVVAVRSKKFIDKFQQYCANELKKRITANEAETKTEVDLQTPYSSKRVDVASIMKDNGPMVTISVKSQMSSAMKNFIHYYEGVVGDVTALHKRFPFLSAGMIWLFPLNPIKEGRTEESVNFDKIEKMFKMATGRKEWNEDISKHEHFCLVVVDFNKDPPEIVRKYPKCVILKIDDFFDNLVTTYKNRTPSLD